MKERPILMNTEMVKAVLTCAKCGVITVEISCPKCGSTERRKTQTRRVIPGEIHIDEKNEIYHWYPPKNRGKYFESYAMDTFLDQLSFRCPYGQVGDVLYVRETWATNFPRTVKPKDLPDTTQILYRADETNPGHDAMTRWESSLHLPKRFSRIHLEITAIRVERVQDISNEDSKAEGVDPENAACNCDGGAYRNGFCGLWDEIYKTWDKNPWVRVVEFKRIDK